MGGSREPLPTRLSYRMMWGLEEEDHEVLGLDRLGWAVAGRGGGVWAADGGGREMTTGFYVRRPGYEDDPVDWYAAFGVNIQESTVLVLYDLENGIVRAYAPGEWSEVWAGDPPTEEPPTEEPAGEAVDDAYDPVTAAILERINAMPEKVKTWREDLGLE